MGLIEELDKLDLADDVKERLRQEHEGEIAPLRDENTTLKSKDKKGEVETEITALADLGFKEAPGLLKFVRRIYLSDDGEPGLVMLSDSDLDLSDDSATGAAGREEITVAGAVRKFIELLPRNAEGKLEFSDMALAGEAGDPPDKGGDTETKDTDGARKRLGAITGQPVVRSGKRYNGGRAVPAGGDA